MTTIPGENNRLTTKWPNHSKTVSYNWGGRQKIKWPNYSGIGPFYSPIFSVMCCKLPTIAVMTSDHTLASLSWLYLHMVTQGPGFETFMHLVILKGMVVMFWNKWFTLAQWLVDRVLVFQEADRNISPSPSLDMDTISSRISMLFSVFGNSCFKNVELLNGNKLAFWRPCGGFLKLKQPQCICHQ